MKDFLSSYDELCVVLKDLNTHTLTTEERINVGLLLFDLVDLCCDQLEPIKHQLRTRFDSTVHSKAILIDGDNGSVCRISPPVKQAGKSRIRFMRKEN